MLGHIAPGRHGIGRARIGRADGSNRIVRALHPGAEVTIVERQPVVIAQRGDNPGHCFVAAAPNIEGKLSLYFARFEGLVDGTRHDHLLEAVNGIKSARGGCRIGSARFDSHM